MKANVGSAVALISRRMRACRRDAQTVARTLELGDQRLLASDGPAGGKLPDLSPDEWGKVYRACVRIARRLA